MRDYFFCTRCGCRVAATVEGTRHYPRSALLYKKGWAFSRIFCIPCYTKEIEKHPVDVF